MVKIKNVINPIIFFHQNMSLIENHAKQYLEKNPTVRGPSLTDNLEGIVLSYRGAADFFIIRVQNDSLIVAKPEDLLFLHRTYHNGPQAKYLNAKFKYDAIRTGLLERPTSEPIIGTSYTQADLPLYIPEEGDFIPLK